MDVILTIILLGIVEGVTEFIPVSSTGHLILAGELLGASDARWQVFNIAIQTGAMLAVVWEYRARFFKVDLQLYRNLIVAFIPAAVLGLARAPPHGSGRLQPGPQFTLKLSGCDEEQRNLLLGRALLLFREQPAAAKHAAGGGAHENITPGEIEPKGETRGECRRPW